MQYIFLSSQQVLILFILLGVGVLATKAKMLDSAGISALTNLALFFATPCAIVKAFFSIKLTPELLGDFFLTAVFAAAATSLGLILSYLLFRKEPQARSAVLRIATAFPNCGFIGIPLAAELLGAESAAYLSIYIVAFNLLIWTWGVRLYPKKTKTSLKTIFLNPGIIGLSGGMLALLYGRELPALLSSPIGYISNLNTPLAMFVLGFYLSGFSFRLGKDTLPVALAVVSRQLIIPLVSIGISWCLGLRGMWLLASMVACISPPALYAVMFAQKFDGDTDIGAKTIAYANLISLVTMPLLLGLCFQLF